MQLSIVSYLDTEATKTTRELQRKLSDISGSVASLQSWEPHITIGDGIEVSDANLALAIDELTNLATSTRPFTIKLNGFGGKTNRKGGLGEITTPYALWMNAEVTGELSHLVKKVRTQITDKVKTWYQMPLPYSPHVTLAFRDLEKAGYWRGIELLKNEGLNFSTVIDHIALVEKLPEKDVEFKRFFFKK